VLFWKPEHSVFIDSSNERHLKESGLWKKEGIHLPVPLASGCVFGSITSQWFGFCLKCQYQWVNLGFHAIIAKK
jgi:hypothetical protein